MKPVIYAALILMIVLAIVLASFEPIGVDFGSVFYPAWRCVWIGCDPYQIAGFYNPPWLLLMSPLALLPMRLAWSIFLIANPLILAVAFRRMGFDWSSILLLSISPFALYNAYYGNIDSIILLGATLPPQYGIWLVLLKPQMGIWLAALWIYRQFRQNGVTGVIRLIAPVALAFTITLLAGVYQLPDATAMPWSADVWPVGIVAGLPILYLAWRWDDSRLALAAAPFLSPYMAIHSWLVVFLPLVTRRNLLIIGITVSWTIVLCLVAAGILT